MASQPPAYHLAVQQPQFVNLPQEQLEKNSGVNFSQQSVANSFPGGEESTLDQLELKPGLNFSQRCAVTNFPGRGASTSDQLQMKPGVNFSQQSTVNSFPVNGAITFDPNIQLLRDQYSNNQVVEEAPIVITFSKEPAHGVYCSACNRSVTTTTRTRHKQVALLWCCILCYFASPLCSFIPFVMSSMKETVHCCPLCKKRLGHYAEDIKGHNYALFVVLLLLVMSIVIGLVIYRINSPRSSYYTYY